MKKNCKYPKNENNNRILLLSFLGLMLINSSLYSATYYFAASGNDGNTATQAQSQSTPWKSITKLNSIISTLLPGDNVFFKRGDIFVGQINILNLSGTSGQPIVFGAYGSGANPVIDGSGSVTTWTLVSGNIWQASFAVGQSIVTCVTIDGKTQDIGRWPNLNTTNKGYLNVDSHINGTQLTSSSLATAPTANWTGAEVVWRGQRWIINRAIITSQSGNSLNFVSPNGYNPINNYGFFIQNHPSTLDQEGEWYYDGTNKLFKLYSSTNPNTKNIRASYLTNNINVTNSNYLTFQNLTLTSSLNLNFSYNGSSYITFKDSKSINAGKNAIYGSSSNNVSILNDTILNTYNNAVDAVNVNTITINNNYIKNTGYVCGMGESGDGCYNSVSVNGFSGSPSLNATMINNTLDSCGYLGLSFYGYSNVLLKNNLISNFCMVKDDGAGLYTYSGGSNTQNYVNRVIESNIVINGLSSPEGTDNFNYTPTAGIYMDDNTKNVSLINNTSANCLGSGLFLHNSHEINLIKNTFYNNSKDQFKFIHDNNNPAEATKNLNVKNNIYFSKLKDQRIGEFSTADNGLYTMGTIDSNYYCRPFNEVYTLSTYDSILFNQNLDLTCWNKTYGPDVKSNITPIQYKHYKINSYVGANLYNGGGTFNTSTNGIGCNNSANDCSVTWDNTGVLDGGCLKFTAGSSNPSRLLNTCGAISNTKNYILKFSLKGTTTCQYLDVYLRKFQSPYNNLTPNQQIKIDTARQEIEILFTNPTSEPSSLVGMDIQTAGGTVYIDNVDLHEANITLVNPDDSIKFEFNPTLFNKVVPLSSTYIDVKNNTYVSSTTLAPFGSVILLAKNCTTFPIPGHIEAESFCSMQGISTSTTSDIGGGYFVGSFDNGDWIDIPVSVSSAGNYVFSFRVACAMSTPSTFDILDAGLTINTVTVPITGGWSTYQTITATASLAPGTRVLRIRAYQAFNLNWIDVQQQGTAGIISLDKELLNAFIYPNPADKFVTVNYSTTTNSLVKISLLDILGKTVEEFDSITQSAGNYSKKINLEKVNSGIYFIKIQIDNKTVTKKIIVN
ncbi:MAG: carbohydrate-binding protein [Bacteroidetes bacterium]|nr:carbohydrate-binding protein [Bacteroidota bacterium]